VLKAENKATQNQYFAVKIIIIILTGILVFRFFHLQVYQYDKFSRRADVNRIRATTVNAPRGLILDRNGRTIVDNYPTYILKAIPDELGDRGEIFTLIEKYIEIDSTILANNFKKYYRGKFVPVRLAKDLSFNQISLLEEHRLELPGIRYEKFHERSYTDLIRGSHFLGYLKEVDQSIRETITDKEIFEYGDLIGWKGLEKIYEDKLRQIKGVTYLEVDAYGREMGKVDEQKDILPIPGVNLHTTIDVELQQFSEELMGEKRGVIIVGDSRTGEIYSYVSKPDYPPELFSGATHPEEWNLIINDPARPLLNRITTGLYPPGSTFKLITVVYILENNIVNPNYKFYCSGEYAFGDRVFRCWKENGHGDMNLRQAIVQSCDVYFYNIIQQIPLNDWARLCRDFGFEKKSGIDLAYERTGIIPDRNYLNSRYGRWGWSTGAKLNLSIGQGEILVTPIQLFTFINLFATSGQSGIPHFGLFNERVEIDAPKLNTRTWQSINSYLHGVVTHDLGTGRSSNPGITGLTVAGKTGSAENPHGDSDAWFIGYGEKDGSLISAVIMIENAGHGGEFAAPMARSIFNFIFGDRTEIELAKLGKDDFNNQR
jgi:penicillin-binding protein 2